MPAMTRYAPFDAGAGSAVTEAQWREMAKHWVADGVISTIGSALVVSATTGLVLAVGSGSCFVQGTFGALDSPGVNVSLTTAHATLGRIDRVVVRLDTVANTISIEVLTGTPNASPVAPALTQNSATWEIALAQVAVAAATASIVSGNITDQRTLITPANGASGLVTSGAGVDVSGAGSPASPYVPAARNRLALPNPVRNPSGLICQRGTSVTPAAGAFGIDGWDNHYRSDIVYSQQPAADTQGDNTCIRVQRPNGNSTTTATGIGHSCMTADSLRFANRQTTMSLRARKGSGASVTLASGTAAYMGTGTNQRVGSGFTGSTTAAVTPPTLTTSWQTISVTFTPGASVTQLATWLVLNWAGTAGANDYFEFKDVRFDEGPYVLEHVGQDETSQLLRCRRLLRVWGGVANIPVGWGSAWGGFYGGNASVHQLTFDPPFWGAPTNAQTGSWEVYNFVDGAADVTNLGGIVADANGGYLIEYRAAGNWTSQSANSLLRPKDTSARLVIAKEI